MPPNPTAWIWAYQKPRGYVAAFWEGPSRRPAYLSTTCEKKSAHIIPQKPHVTKRPIEEHCNCAKYAISRSPFSLRSRQTLIGKPYSGSKNSWLCPGRRKPQIVVWAAVLIINSSPPGSIFVNVKSFSQVSRVLPPTSLPCGAYRANKPASSSRAPPQELKNGPDPGL